MKVITEPTIRVVGQTQFISHPKYPIPDDGSDAVKLGAFAAKGCYDSFGKEGRANTENQSSILEHRHGSVMEHGTVSLYIEGVTRALTLELNRHRTLAISQRSTRYTKEDDAAIVLEPYYASLFHKFKIQKSINFEWTWGDAEMWNKMTNTLYNTERNEFGLIANHLNNVERAIDQYVDEVKLLMKLNPLNLTGFDLRKWSRGKARNILPHELETRATYTNNHRGWRWIIECRSDKHAEAEIRRLAWHIYDILRTVAPEYYNDFEVVEIYDNIPVLKPKHSKV